MPRARRSAGRIGPGDRSKRIGTATRAAADRPTATDRELVEANSKLGLIAGLAGAVAVIPAAALQYTVGATATLAYGALLFAVALFASFGLPRELAIRPGVPSAARRTDWIRL